MVSKNRTIDSAMLRAFVEVANRNGVTAAAISSGVTKSAISKHVSSLESLLQVRLFERNARRMSLTQEGKALLTRSESILADLEQLVADALEQKSVVRGTVSLAASPEFGALLSAHFIPSLLAQHPELRVSMSLDYAYDDLHDPGVDLAFRLGALHDERVVARQLGKLKRVLVCSPDYARSQAIKVPADLAKVNALLFLDKEGATEWTLHPLKPSMKASKVKVNGRYSVQGVGALAEAAIAGMGVALLPEFVVNPALATGALVQVLEHWNPPPLPVYLAYRAGVTRVARVRAVVEAAAAFLPSFLDSGISR